MAGGKSYKFQDSSVAVIASYAATKTITAITKANPAVVSSATHGYTDGDLVLIDNVVGMTEVNGGLYVVDNSTTGTFELLGVDSTGYGTYVSGGTAAEGVFTNFCEVKGYNRSGGSATEIDTTTICSTAKEFKLGLQDFGTTQLDINYAPDTSIQIALAALAASGDLTAVRLTLPGSGGSVTQLGYVQSTSESGSVDGVFTGSVTIRNTGAPIRLAA